MARLQLTSKERYWHPDFEELLEFFRDRFALDWTVYRAEDTARLDRNLGRYMNDEDFTRRTAIFCYHNLINTLQGVHRKYMALLFQLTADCGPVSILEVGPGGGQLGLALHTFGFRVGFAELLSTSALYLVWRLRNRQIDLPVYIIDAEPCDIPKYNVVIAFDVIEHIETHDDQVKLLDRMSEWGEMVMVNLLCNDPLPGVHHDVDVPRLTEHLLAKLPGKTWFGDFYPDDHGVSRQRLLIYGDGVKSEYGGKLNVSVTPVRTVKESDGG
uniref:Putative methyltransferase n=1 Tax=viral metagenome TaxID=1070528 RepID=A0A6M3KKG4_9ZZZZ